MREALGETSGVHFGRELRRTVMECAGPYSDDCRAQDRQEKDNTSSLSSRRRSNHDSRLQRRQRPRAFLVDKSPARPPRRSSDKERKEEDDCKKGIRGREERLLAVAHKDVPGIQRLPA